MQIPVSSALELKNEVSRAVSELQGRLRGAGSYGKEGILGVVTVNGQQESFGAETVVEIIEKLRRAFAISHELNSKIGEFNQVNGVYDKVRLINNLKCEASLLNNLLPHTKPKSSKHFEDGHEVLREFTPYLSTSEVRDRIKELRNEARELQNEVTAANNQAIELSFTYEQVDGLS